MNKAPEIRRLMAGVVVDDLEAAGGWYQAMLGRPPDATPMGGLLEWHLASDAWLQVVDIAKVREIQHAAQWGSAGASSVSFVVAHLDDQLAAFAENGIAIVSQYTTGSSLKTATVRDPAGNFVTFVEDMHSYRE